MSDTPPPSPPDPNAPQEHKLPSGPTVTLASHRTLHRPEIHKVWKSVTDQDMAMAQEHDALICMLVVDCDDPHYPVPWTLDTLNHFEADDYTALFRLVGEAYRLVHGLSVIPRYEEHEDPKAPTGPSNGSAPASRATTSSPSTETTGTTSKTTSTSTAPAAGAPTP